MGTWTLAGCTLDTQGCPVPCADDFVCVDGECVSQSSVDTGSTDTGSRDTGTDTSEFSCDDVPIEGNIGEICESTADCDSIGCTRLRGETDASCFQLCAPETCEDVCSGDTICSQTFSDGEMTTFDDGTPRGACLPRGRYGAYELCRQDGECASEQCSFLEGIDDPTRGTCLPVCADFENSSDCTDHAEFSPACFEFTELQTGYCWLPCVTDVEGSCPSGMTCLGETTGWCVVE